MHVSADDATERLTLGLGVEGGREGRGGGREGEEGGKEGGDEQWREVKKAVQHFREEYEFSKGSCCVRRGVGEGEERRENMRRQGN